MGFILNLGHNGEVCPLGTLANPIFSYSELCDLCACCSVCTALYRLSIWHVVCWSKGDNKPDNQITVVDSAGVFVHLVKWCRCHGAGNKDKYLQLLQHHLFSSTIFKPQTAFTFDGCIEWISYRFSGMQDLSPSRKSIIYIWFVSI
jgi:hypothetical protein